MIVIEPSNAKVRKKPNVCYFVLIAGRCQIIFSFLSTNKFTLIAKMNHQKLWIEHAYSVFLIFKGLLNIYNRNSFGACSRKNRNSNKINHMKKNRSKLENEKIVFGRNNE